MKNQSNSVGHSFCRVAVVSAAGFVCGVGAAFADITPKETASATRLEIQNAIDAAAVANPVGTVTLGNGTFEIDAQLMVTGGVTLVGQGWENTIIKQTATGDDKRCATLEGGAKLQRVTLTGGCINGNNAPGAGVSIKDGTVSWCCISNNTAGVASGASVYGAGVGFYQGKGQVDHSIIAGNRVGSTTALGGGIAIYQPTGAITIDTCLIVGNVATGKTAANGKGGGVYVEYTYRYADVTISNSTIADNSASGTAQGGGVYVSGDSDAKGTHTILTNDILAGNTSAGAENNAVLPVTDKTSYCLFGLSGEIAGTGSISGTPEFVDAANGDYHLGEESPAIRAGSAYEGIGNDLDNQAFASTPSIGCYEYLGVLLVAKPVFTPATDTTFSPSVYVTLSCPTDGAEIYYTTNGSDPTDSSTPYNGSIYIANTITIKARAYKSGMSPSRIVTAEYTLGTPTSPEFGTVSVDPKAMVATISGEIVSVGNNLATSCDVYLALGSDYGSYGERTLVVQGATTSFSYVIPNLVPERTYYYELTIVNNAQSEMSASTQGSFTTTPREQVQPVEDDAAATRSRIQEAIDAAVLEVPAGTVALAAGLFEIDTQLMVTGGVTLVGQGWDKTIIKQTATTATVDTRCATIDGGAKIERVALTGGAVTGNNGPNGANWKYGGGVKVLDGMVSWCCITNNVVDNGNCNYGGGVFIQKGQIDHSIIADNRVVARTGSENLGGGICIRQSAGAIIIDSCLISGNCAYNDGHTGRGGGIGVDTLTHSFAVRNTTIVTNESGNAGGTSAAGGGAIYITGDSKNNLSMINCIVAGNVTVNTNITVSVSSTGGVDYCFFDVADDVLGANSKTGDPRFFSVEKGNFKLRSSSPCIDAGFAGEWITDTSLALDGNPRIMGRAPDMGCYETYHAGFTIRLR